MPRGTKAPKLWPAEPVKCMRIVSSGRPSGPWRRVSSEAMVLLDHPPDGDLGADRGPVEDGREVEPARLPVVHGMPHVEEIRAADQLVHGAGPELGQVLAHLFGDEAEESLHELGLARELGTELGVLGGDAHGARIEMADAHHD